MDVNKKMTGGIFTGIGANLVAEGFATPRETCMAALEYLVRPGSGIGLARISPWYRTPPWPPGTDAPRYDNAVAEIATALPPPALLAAMHACEARFGRKREAGIRNAPRVIDLDIIDYRGVVSGGGEGDDWEGDDGEAMPILPHPRAHLRGFVLYPLRDIAPGWVHPRLATGIDALIEALPEDEEKPQKIPSPTR